MDMPPMALVGVLGAGVGALGSILNRAMAVFEARERRRFADESAPAAPPIAEPAGVWPWVTAVRALTRPALTLLLWLLFTGLFLTAVLGGLAPEAAAKVISTALDTVAFAASTAMTWWFGDRGPRRG
jgi:hypothetical protein